MSNNPAPFVIHLHDDVLGDLRNRLRNTRWPDEAPGAPWSQGTDRTVLRSLVDEWAEGFDWREQERALNRYPHFMAEISGTKVHFIHVRNGKPPLILTHGWPSSFVEFLPLVDRLSQDFDLIIPSLPGYGFSERPARVGIDAAYTAGLWLNLMEQLGYSQFGAIGGDFGAAVTTHLALIAPERATRIMITTPEMHPVLDANSHPLSTAEKAYLKHVEGWDATERGYSSIQSTRPQTVGYGLSDSPVGLAAWLIEKWRAWSDSDGDVLEKFGTDFLLTNLTLYWATNSITPSMRDYFDARWHSTALTGTDFVSVPTAISVFANEFAPTGTPPREWYERLYNVQQWSIAAAGGHFAAAEEPDRVAHDVQTHFTAAFA
ncbi:epoxide hydrolase [Cryobacterium melibiosiphilum]|uniref:Epoxide hydrolase n=1 Tax=Cryobacterium melibiosiphilum TaxID=995039 RepID=A0A3A5MIM2_9MICO|nr:epoxide hydrolase [Cryobacterium melibiosiphilum]RJT90017.1 epoxide hydrolase [Cryobacterium melibiosiphilum]